MLKDSVNDILVNFDMNFTDQGKYILKKTANDEKMINYKNLFFITSNTIIDNFSFVKRFGTLYNLLIDLLSEDISTLQV